MALKFAMILEAVDRMSRPAKRAAAGARALAQDARRLSREGAPAARALDRVSSAAGRMRGRLSTALTRVRALAGRAGMQALQKSAYGAGYAIGWTIRKVATLAAGLAKLAGGAALVGGGAFFSGVIGTTAKFEQFQIMLEGVEGSAAKAKASMDWVRNFAKTTPYELEQVMQAFVQLKAYGIDPLDGSLAAAGDAAAGMSKDLMQAIEALADAQTGEFERLKEFGIRARSEGNRVRFSYMKNGKEITREVAANAAAMKDAITGIWSDRFGGMIARQSQTFSGMISNLKDSWTDFMLRVGQAGVFDKVKAKLQGVLGWLNGKLDDGSIDRWADTVSTHLERVIDWVGQLSEQDLSRFAQSLGKAAEGFLAIGKAAGWAVGKVADAMSAIGQWDAQRQARWAEGIEKGWLTSDTAKREARAKRQAIERQYGPLTESGQDDNNAWIGGYLNKRKELDRARRQRGAARSTPINLRGTPIPPRASVAPQKVAVGGAMTVKVEPPAGWSARPTSMASANPSVPMIYRGPMMRGMG